MLPLLSRILVEAISMYKISAWTDNFMDENCLKKVFPIKKIEKVNITIELCIIELVWVPNFSLNWQLPFFEQNLHKKGISSQKPKKWTAPSSSV